VTRLPSPFFACGIRRTALLGVCLHLPFLAGAQNAAATAASGTGKFAATARYRYEIYSQDSTPAVPITDDAAASTLRIALGYETPPLQGVSVFAEYEGVRQVGTDNYRIPTVPKQNRTTLAPIIDPEGDELNQVFVKYAAPDGSVVLKVGRQEIMLNDGRFVSISLWRQNHQTFDAVTVYAAPRRDVTVFYGYLGEVQRVNGGAATDGRLEMNSHLGNVAYKRPGALTATAYAYVLDNRDGRLPASTKPLFYSTKTFGVRVEGPRTLSKDWSLLYTGEFAHQSDNAGNPNLVNARYVQVRAGAGYRGTNLDAGYLVLSGTSATNKFQTPMSHPINSWVEKFSANPSVGPNHGLRIATVALGGPMVPGLTYNVIFYDYRANSGSAPYGRELDLALEYRVLPVDKRWVVGWRFGHYRADQLFTHSLRTSGFTSFTF
jgi:hypothetical protein